MRKVELSAVTEALSTLCQERLTTEKYKTAEDISAFISALHDIFESMYSEILDKFEQT